MLDLLNELRMHKEKQHHRELCRHASRRGLVALGLISLATCVAWLCSRPSREGPPAGMAGPNGERLVHCFFLLDHTGSMRPLQSAVVSSFNQYVEQQQKQPGSMLLTLASFNSNAPLDLRFEGRDIHSVRPLTTYEPSGSTPLYDALALLLEHVSKVASSGSHSAQTRYVPRPTTYCLLPTPCFLRGRPRAKQRLTRCFELCTG